MRVSSGVAGLVVGVALGATFTAFCIGQTVRRNVINDPPNLLQAGSNDRFEDYIMCTGAVSLNSNPRAQTDGLWLLDYRAGKLLATVIDRTQGKIVTWDEVNVAQDFGIPPKQNVHFMMTTGTITAGQSALYVVETTTGKYAVYTLGPDPNNQRPGAIIRKHDIGSFRNSAVKN